MIQRVADAVLVLALRVLTSRAAHDLCWACGWLRAFGAWR